MKVLLVGFKMISRPLNNVLKRIFTHRFAMMHKFIERCGQAAHKFEIYLNRKIVNTGGPGSEKLDFYIKPLSDDAAFNKGIDYFVEVVFFYGVLISIAIFEIKRSQDASDKLKATIAELQKSAIMNNSRIQQLEEELNAKKTEVDLNLAEIERLKEEVRQIQQIVLASGGIASPINHSEILGVQREAKQI